MTCSQMSGILPRIAERDGSPRVAFEAARHLASCTRCAAELLRLREVNGLLDLIPHADVPESFPRRVLRALKTRGGSGAMLLALIASGAGTGALAPRGHPGLLTTALFDPLQAAGSLLSSFALVAIELAAPAREAIDAGLRLSFPGGSFFRFPAALFALVPFAAVTFAAAWIAFGIGALRISRVPASWDPANSRRDP